MIPVLAETFAVSSILSFLVGMRCHGLHKYKQQVALSYSLQGVGHDGIYDEVEWYDRARKFLFASSLLFALAFVVVVAVV